MICKNDTWDYRIIKWCVNGVRGFFDDLISSSPRESLNFSPWILDCKFFVFSRNSIFHIGISDISFQQSYKKFLPQTMQIEKGKNSYEIKSIKSKSLVHVLKDLEMCITILYSCSFYLLLILILHKNLLTFYLMNNFLCEQWVNI